MSNDPTGVCGKPLTTSELRALVEDAREICRRAVASFYASTDATTAAIIRDLVQVQPQFNQDAALLQAFPPDVEASTVGMVSQDAVCGRVMTIWTQARLLPYNATVTDAITRLLYRISSLNKKYQSGSWFGTTSKVILALGLAGLAVFAIYKFTPVGRLR
jgi:hypothetical protein